MTKALLIESWAVPAELRARKQDALKFSWWTVVALWRSRPLALGLLVVIALLDAAAFRVFFLILTPDVSAGLATGLSVLGGVVVMGLVLWVTTAQMLFSRRAIVLTDGRAVAVAKGKREGAVEVWTLVNHSVQQMGRGHGRVFREPLWALLITAAQAGVDVRMRASHPKVHRIYLTELIAHGAQLRPIMINGAPSKKNRHVRRLVLEKNVAPISS